MEPSHVASRLPLCAEGGVWRVGEHRCVCVHTLIPPPASVGNGGQTQVSAGAPILGSLLWAFLPSENLMHTSGNMNSLCMFSACI